VARWREDRLQRPSQRLLAYGEDLLEGSTSYLAERRRTMIFAVRDRLRAEERHLAATRERLVREARHLLVSAAQGLAGQRQLLAAYDPTRRLAQGWSIVTDAHGSLVRSIEELTVGDAVEVLVSDGSFRSTVVEMKGTRT
jgi:exonuclease VII large subunit